MKRSTLIESLWNLSHLKTNEMIFFFPQNVKVWIIEIMVL